VALGPLGTPPAPKVPTLPAPLGPQLSFRALRATKLFTQRTLPVRIGCDTACTVTVGGTLTQRSEPRKGHKRVTVKLGAHTVALPAGETKIVRLAVSRTSVGRLRKALRGRRGLVATIQVTATASAGEPSEITKRLQASG
jgi:hypothetical protein